MPKVAVTSQPLADLPIMPADFGLKPRKSYLPWSHAVERLEKARNYWIVTATPDGTPHAMPVWGFFIDNALYWGTGRETRKWRNLARNPRVVVHLESGDDVIIVEGEAQEVLEANEPELFAKLKAASQKKYGMWMPLDPKKHVAVRVIPRKVLAWSEQGMPDTATRWRFP